MATVTLKTAGDVFHVALFREIVCDLDRAATRARFLDRVDARLAQSEVAVISWALLPDRAYLGLVGSATAVRDLVARLAAADGVATRRPGAGGDLRAAELTDRCDVVAGNGPAFVAEMIAFHHNAPVRAGLCDSAWATSRTSHRAYIHLCPRPPFLSCGRGLALCGTADTVEGRQRFDEAVLFRGQRCSPGPLGSTESHSVVGVAAPRANAGRQARAVRALVAEPATTRSLLRPPAQTAAPTFRRTELSLATTALVAPPPRPLRATTTAVGSPVLDRPALGRPAAPMPALTSAEVPADKSAKELAEESLGEPIEAPTAPAITVARVLEFAAAAVGTAAARLREGLASDLVRLALRASWWCWIRRLDGATEAMADATGVGAPDIRDALNALDKDGNSVARRLGDWLARDLTHGRRGQPSIGVPQPTSRPATGAPTGVLSGDYTDVIATHPGTALSDVLTAH